MTKKYHIGKDGTPKECRAETRPCTLGNHFNDFDEAQKYADNLNESMSSINALVKQEDFRRQFTKKQLYLIDEGIKKELDVSWYAKPEFNDDQMRQIYWGLEEGLDVSTYANPIFDAFEMYEIRKNFINLKL